MKAISKDWWTVIVALGAVILVKSGIIPAIPW
jgi:hypothetical protein